MERRVGGGHVVTHIVIRRNMVILQGLVLAAEGGSTHHAGNLDWNMITLERLIDSGGTYIEL